MPPDSYVGGFHTCGEGVSTWSRNWQLSRKYRLSISLYENRSILYYTTVSTPARPRTPRVTIGSQNLGQLADLMEPRAECDARCRRENGCHVQRGNLGGILRAELVLHHVIACHAVVSELDSCRDELPSQLYVSSGDRNVQVVVHV